MEIKLTINGDSKKFEVDPSTRLIDLLRSAGYQGVKKGCDEGHCGSCTVLLDGQPILSCIKFAAQADGAEITTIEGMGTVNDPHPLQQSFVDKGAVQCGFCIPGMILSSKSLLETHPDPTEDEIKRGLDGNYCRCTGYVKQIEAVQSAAQKMRGGI